MSDKKLVFKTTKTLADFKAQANIKEIEILKNPNTNKLFFTTELGSGAVSNSFDKNEDVYISLVHPKGDSSNQFLMIHNKGAGATVEYKL